MVQLEYVNIYDVNNNLIDSWINLSGSSTGITFFLFPITCSVNKVVYAMKFSGITYETTKYVQGNNRNQYFYFNDNYIDTIYCTGKKENSIELTRDYLKAGTNNNIVQIKYTNKITQNTGFKLSEQELFDLNSSPYVFEVSGTTVKNYIFSDVQVQGYNTRVLNERNTVINLTKDTIEKRYTNTENNFYN